MPLAQYRHSLRFRPPEIIYNTLRSLFRLLSRCRGVRLRRRWKNSICSNFALVNARSLNSKSELVVGFMSTADIDIVAVNEFWQGGENGDDEHRAICPLSFSFSFFLGTNWKGNKKLTVDEFLAKFESFMGSAAVVRDKLFVVDDFNLHVDDPTCLPAIKLLSMMDFFGFHQ